ncbi:MULTISPECIES: hypothetical protein [Methylosinus]|uniref:Uncharacterized protein n=1 Tax=Methylosinus trichosporium (strain ATCC 35070 / NCIMB 11131 / UNIQEM 75 / OB3b) TaxID=595536 RepID=A0A2D2D5P6_METT3|nr:MULTISPECIES: hypothetical protein [Methylosinus]ATQ70340.1 hypothetical protein CQW49_11390 [Methylosinus trichosporium OB3b]OBS51397.1 hypothetical protein A8B73_16815 [Methylosinus sp. 3S-1]
MRHFVSLSAGLACLCAVTTAGDALAKHRRHAVREVVVVASGPIPYARVPLAVPRRSWLDPGPVVPVGTTNRYFVETTFFAYHPIERNQPNWYGDEVLPKRYRLDVVPYSDGVPFWGP